MLRYVLDELPRVLVRLASAMLVYEALVRIPWPGTLGHWITLAAAALLAATFLVVCGKFLYDTLFYDHYWRQVDSR